MNYQYRIYPSIEQEARMDSWLEMLRSVFNYALRERKDWVKSRKCAINACSLSGEYIMTADAPYPDYYKQQNALTAAKKVLRHLKDIQSQVIQEPLRRVDAAFVARQGVTGSHGSRSMVNTVLSCSRSSKRVLS